MHCLNLQDDYTRNKADPDAIISLDANNKMIRTTAEQLPTPSSFQRWKIWSDKSYHKIHLGNRSYKEHTVSLGKYIYTLSTDQISKENAAKEWRHRLYLKVDRTLQEILTKKQYRRFIMRHEKGMLEIEIARAEHVVQSTISETLRRAKNRVEKFF